jgi:hypothetical protein
LFLILSLLQQNPELAKLMENAPEGVSFEQLLAQIKNGEVDAENIDPELLAQMSKNQLDQKSLQIGDTNPQNLQVSITKHNLKFHLLSRTQPQVAEGKSIIMQPQVAAETSVPGKNAEDASRAFMPERKSIFAVNKQQPSKAAAQARVNNGLMDFNTFMSKQAPATKANMAQTAYANQAHPNLCWLKERLRLKFQN